MKILHVLYSNRFSGAENVVCQIIGMMKKVPGVEMVYCSPDGQIREALGERGIAFEPIADLCKSELRRVIAKVKPDVVHAHDMRASFVAALACKRIPLISHIHNNAFDSRGLSPKSIAYTIAARKAKRIFWVSESAFEGYAFHKRFAKKSEVLRNIIDIDALYAKMALDEKEYSYDLAYVGRLTYPKNPQRLMGVIAKMKELKPDVRVAVVGNGDLEEETHALAEEYGICDNIDFLGFQSNPLKILHGSSSMIMVSRWEGTPMCALEAMALGVPIVSTPVDGLKVLVQQNENGYLSDDDGELAKKVVEIATDPALRERLSKDTLEKARILNNTTEYTARLLKAYGSAK
jgi:glycosyltransferase involved in cell wall biosynthesis